MSTRDFFETLITIMPFGDFFQSTWWLLDIRVISVITIETFENNWNCLLVIFSGRWSWLCLRRLFSRLLVLQVLWILTSSLGTELISFVGLGIFLELLAATLKNQFLVFQGTWSTWCSGESYWWYVEISVPKNPSFNRFPGILQHYCQGLCW